MPPAVGIAEASSDIEKATVRISKLITGHPIEIATGPPLFQACPNVVKQPASTEMIEKEIAKLEKLLQPRCSSCLYPSSASRFSSAPRVSGVAIRALPSKELGWGAVLS